MSTNPKYDATGELVCGSCGKVLARASNRFGDSVASCSDPGCPGNGRLIEEGSFRHNPMIPENRKAMPIFDSPARFIFGASTFVVKDGVKQNV